MYFVRSTCLLVVLSVCVFHSFRADSRTVEMSHVSIKMSEYYRAAKEAYECDKRFGLDGQRWKQELTAVIAAHFKHGEERDVEHVGPVADSFGNSRVTAALAEKRKGGKGAATTAASAAGFAEGGGGGEMGRLDREYAEKKRQLLHREALSGHQKTISERFFLPPRKQMTYVMPGHTGMGGQPIEVNVPTLYPREYSGMLDDLVLQQTKAPKDTKTNYMDRFAVYFERSTFYMRLDTFERMFVSLHQFTDDSTKQQLRLFVAWCRFHGVSFQIMEPLVFFFLSDSEDMPH